ncbi:hypothetical protein I312_104916 [Cryptococcus bacillisporus CA1280]|uniref:uncharacterized protein n=1 Tax=Cryptococcus bacillisporus CA1280 TaxID=1296109 RepID=UPI003368C56B
MDVLDLVNDHNHVGAGHNGQTRPYVCTFGTCDKAFARKSDLARHYKIHTNDRAFVCTYRGCGKSFIQRSALTVHYRVHTGERPHHCETCNKAFADSSSLARHRRIHTGKRPYTCYAAGCGKPFARRNTLLKHFKRQHPQLPPPSTSAQRTTVRMPVQSLGPRSSTASLFSQQSLNSNEERYSASPSIAGAPHGFAAPQPPKGAAYSLYGGFPEQVLGVHQSTQQPVIFQGSGGIRPHFQQSLITSPISTSRPHFVGGHAAQTPTSPAIHERDKHSISPVPSIATKDFGLGQYASPLSAYPHASSYPLTRITNDSGIIWPKSILAPGESRYEASQWSGGNVGGGFHASQLSVPHTPTHLSLSYPYHLPMQQRSATNPLPKTRKLYSPSCNGSDDERDEPLVSLSDAHPTFAIHPPQGTVGVPMSNVEVSSVSHMPNHGAQILFAPSQNGQHHSAPPVIQRFNSMPAVPTMSSWGQNSEYQTQSAGDAKSADEEWEGLEKEMLSREMSVGADNKLSPVTEEEKTPKDGEPINYWGEPIAYPAHPDLQHRKNPFHSISSNFVHHMHSSDPLPPIQIFSNQPHHMVLTPINPNGMYPTPITHGEEWAQRHIKPITMLGQGHPQQHIDVKNKENGNEIAEHIALTTPPKHQGHRKDERSVTAVGLGIANVHFTQSNVIDTDHASEVEMEDLESEESDATPEDDSDDEFVLGRKPRKNTKKGGVWKRGARTATKRRHSSR